MLLLFYYAANGFFIVLKSICNYADIRMTLK